MINNFFKKLFKRINTKNYPFKEDAILKQERFEPAEWSISIEEQLYLSQNSYIIGAKADTNYIKKRLGDPKIKGLARVAVPKLSYLARINNIKNPYADIGVLIEHVCELIFNQRQGKFTHYRKGQLGPNRIQCIQKLVDRRREFEMSIPGDILILDVDLGNKYAGWTPRRAREDVIYNQKCIALSSVDLCWILLVNPSRLHRNVDLSIDSVMEEYYSEDRGWVTNLFFYFRGGKLEFGYRWNRRAYFDCGAAIAIIN